MTDLGKLLLVAGVLIAILGGVLLLAGRSGLPIGRLPGDLLYRGKNTTVYFPLMTSLAVSLVLSLLLYLIGRMKH